MRQVNPGQVLLSEAGYPGFTAEHAALATFGRPARTCHVGGYTILACDRSLLREPAGPSRGRSFAKVAS